MQGESHKNGAGRGWDRVVWRASPPGEPVCTLQVCKHARGVVTLGAQHMQAVPLPATTALMSTPGLMTLGGSALMARFFRPCMRRACVGVRASPPLPLAAQQAGKGPQPRGGWQGNEASENTHPHLRACTHARNGHATARNGPDAWRHLCTTACCLIAALVLRHVLVGSGKPNKAPAPQEKEREKASREEREEAECQGAVSDDACSSSSLSATDTSVKGRWASDPAQTTTISSAGAVN